MERILVIDDSPTTVTFVRNSLVGCDVKWLQVFIDLAHVLNNWDPDLVVVDLEMPMLSGIKQAGFVRKFAQRRLPIVVYSSRPRAEIEQAAAEIGASAALEKGITPQAFRAAILKLLPSAAKERVRP